MTGVQTCALPISSGQNALFGTSTDSANGRIQLATHTTSAGGIGFGTDIALYRSGPATAILETSIGGTGFRFDNGGAGSGNARLLATYGAMNIASNGANSVFIQTNGTTALTLDSSQNATFAGTASIKGYVIDYKDFGTKTSGSSYNIVTLASVGNTGASGKIKMTTMHNAGQGYIEYSFVYSVNGKALSLVHQNQPYAPSAVTLSLNTSTGVIATSSLAYDTEIKVEVEYLSGSVTF